MNDEELNMYKRYLLNYRVYVNKLKQTDIILEELEHKRLNLRSINFDKVPVQGSGDPLTKELNLLSLIDELENYRTLKSQLERNIHEIDEDLEQLDEDIAEAIKNIYCLRKSTAYKEARKRYVSETTLKRMMNAEMKKLKKTLKWTESI